MATRDYMKGDYPNQGAPRGERRAVAQAKPGRTKLELALAAAGFIAWIWCALEVIKALH